VSDRHPDHNERQLRASHVAAIVIGAIVGVGIFFTPASVAKAVPTSAWVLGIWILGGVASVTGALVFADLGAVWPRAGGLYVFLREGFVGRVGSALSFLYGWLQLVVVQPGAMAVIAIVLVDHIAYLTGPISPFVRTAMACGAILIFTAANLLGLKAGGRIQLGMAALKIGALVLLMIVAVIFGSAARIMAPDSVTPASASGSMTSWVLFGMIPVLFTFGGSYHGTFIAGSVRDPEKNVPRGIAGGILIVLVLYLGVNVAYLGLLGHERLAASSSPAADAIGLALGASAGKVVAAAILVSAAGILNTICLGFPFVIYAMAKDGAFIARAGQLNPHTGRPTVAVALQGLFGCAAVIIGSSRIDILLTGIAFADATFQAAVAIVHIRRRDKAARFAFGGAAWLFLVIEVGIAIGCLVRAPLESVYGVMALVIGAVVWFVWRRKASA